jgi:hypothetical protein
VVERAYLASKKRATAASRGSRQKSFGVREEHRVSWTLFRALRTRLDDGDEEADLPTLEDCPSYLWPVTTSSYLTFLERNMDKFTTGFEYVLAKVSKGVVTWEDTKMMTMFLRCLRFSFNAHDFARESALWWSRRAFDPRSRREGGRGRIEVPHVWYGLGLCNTVARYGYGWLEPRFDWNRLTFSPDVAENVLFGNRVLQQRYLQSGGHARQFRDIFLQAELALGWFRDHRQVAAVEDQLLQYMVELCLRQFRIDVLTSVADEISPDERDEALEGDEPFTHRYFGRIMSGGVHLVSGNKSRFKAPAALARYLFDTDDGKDHHRLHWDEKPYRQLLRHVRRTLESLPTVVLPTVVLPTVVLPPRDHFGTLLDHRFIQRHWIWPYCWAGGLTQTTKEGRRRRMWYSVRTPRSRRGRVRVDDTPLDQWEWARGDFQRGEPAPFPKCAGWSTERWRGWVAEQVGGAGPRSPERSLPSRDGRAL